MSAITRNVNKCSVMKGLHISLTLVIVNVTSMLLTKARRLSIKKTVKLFSQCFPRLFNHKTPSVCHMSLRHKGCRPSVPRSLGTCPETAVARWVQWGLQGEGVGESLHTWWHLQPSLEGGVGEGEGRQPSARQKEQNGQRHTCLT